MHETKAGRVVALWLVTAFTVAAANRAHAAGKPIATDCRLKEYASLDVQLSSDGALIAPVTVNGKLEHMLFSLSNEYTMIDQIPALRLGLAQHLLPGGTRRVMLGNQRLEKFTSIDEFGLGTLSFHHLQTLILPPPKDDRNPDRAETIGVLGIDLLRNVDVELDLGHKRINLYSTDHCPDDVVYWADKYDAVPMGIGPLQDLYFVTELDGKKLQTKFQTSGAVSVLHMDVVRKLYGWDKKSPGIEAVAEPTGQTTWHYRAKDVASGGLKILNADILLVPIDTGSCLRNATIGYDEFGAARYEGCMGAYPLEIGTNALRQLRVYISTKEKMMYFTVADAQLHEP